MVNVKLFSKNKKNLCQPNYNKNIRSKPLAIACLTSRRDNQEAKKEATG
jgi:hypothetical protein